MGIKDSKHICVIDGYRVTHDNGDKTEEVHILDPPIEKDNEFFLGLEAVTYFVSN
jgi:hypothetical protein